MSHKFEHRRWTEADIQQLTALYAAGVSRDDMAMLMKRGFSSIANKVQELGLHRDNGPRSLDKSRGVWTSEDLNLLAELYRSGMTIDDIALRLKRSMSATRLRIHLEGMERPDPRTRELYRRRRIDRDELLEALNKHGTMSGAAEALGYSRLFIRVMVRHYKLRRIQQWTID